jgi:leader peptidase (prepilin peptidase) / N-methyltransferase
MISPEHFVAAEQIPPGRMQDAPVVTSGPVKGKPGRQVILSFALLAAVGGSLLAAPGPQGLFGAFLGGLMLAIAVVDADRYIIPNELTGAALALALFRAGAIGPEADWRAVLWAALQAIAVTVPLLALMAGYRRWRGRDGLGLGDVKLAAVAGASLGLVTIFAVIELAALSALGVYAVNAYLRKRPLRGNALLPFGLFLAPAIWIGWLVETLWS